MKVLFLSNEHRGPETAYAHRLAKLMGALGEHGVETDFVSLREHGIGRPILAQPLGFPFIRRRLAGVDFIHAGGNAGYTAGLLRAYTRAWIIQDIHGDSVSEAKVKWSQQRDVIRGYWLAQAVIADAVTYRLGDCFTVVSERLRTKLTEERGISEDRIAIVRNGVDLDVFEPAPVPAHEGFVVAYAGGFQHWQGIENLIRAGELLGDGHTRLKIVGFGPRDERLRSSLAARLGRRVELVNRVTRPELVTHLAAADVLIIPRPRHAAVQAAFPTKFSEYLAMGKPVIVCDVDETATLVRRHQCGLVAEPNPRSIADTITIASKLPREELERMGRNGRRLAEREFSWKEVGRRYAALLTHWSSADTEAKAQAR
jgi:glycosyltransferase involved in cell wall biosynthesis